MPRQNELSHIPLHKWHLNTNYTTQYKLYCKLFLPNQVHFPIRGKHVTCCGSKLTPYGEQNSLTPQGNNNFNFRLARDQVVLFETVANLCASQHKANNFAVFPTFELRGIAKHLISFNPVIPNSDLQILLCLMPDDITCQRETPWVLKG